MPTRTERTENPQYLLWVHQTISPTFSQGAPTANGGHLPGEMIAKVANDLKTKKVKMDDFPAMAVFSLTDPVTNDVLTYSLSNRRLTAYRMAGLTECNVRPANFDEVYGSLWKMTSRDGGYSQPKQTSTASEKESEPAENTTLGRFKLMMDNVRSFSNEQCDNNKIVGNQKERFVRHQLIEAAKRNFRLR